MPCNWDKVDGFRSLDEYEQTLALLQEQVKSGTAAAVDLDPQKRWGTAFDEHWFRCHADGQVWRLVAPDPPFRGVFKPLRTS